MSRHSDSRQKIRFGPLFFGGALFLLGVVPYFFADYWGVPFGFLGTAVWLFTFLLTFLLGVAYHALSLLPAEIDNWYEEGIRLILQNYFAGGVDEDPNLRNPDLPPSMRIMRAGMIDSHLVLVLGRGPHFSRAAGPGYVKLEKGEHIRQIIDLRTHRRQTQLEAMTRDGIPLKATLRVDFHIRRLPPEEVPAGVPFPYDPEAIFAAYTFSSFGEAEAEIPWMERVAPMSAATALTEISSYTLDDAYQTIAPTPRWRALDPTRLQHQLKMMLNEKLAGHGIEIADLTLFDWRLPEDVLAQRIINWQRKWEKQMRTVLNQQEVDWAMLVAQMQGAANVELVQQIMRHVEQIGQSDEWLDVVTLLSMDALEDAATEVSGEMPSQIWETLSELQVMAAQPPLLTDGSGSDAHFSTLPTPHTPHRPEGVA